TGRRLMRVTFAVPVLAICAAACSGSGAAPDGAVSGCLAQATAVYDATPVVRRADGSVWVLATDRTKFVEIQGPAGHLHATDIAASGSTAYGTAVGCAIVSGGGVWCFPLAGQVTDSTNLGAGLGAGVTTTAAVAVVTGPADASPAPLAAARQIGASMFG